MPSANVLFTWAHPLHWGIQQNSSWNGPSAARLGGHGVEGRLSNRISQTFVKFQSYLWLWVEISSLCTELKGLAEHSTVPFDKGHHRHVVMASHNEASYTSCQRKYHQRFKTLKISPVRIVTVLPRELGEAAIVFCSSSWSQILTNAWNNEKKNHEWLSDPFFNRLLRNDMNKCFLQNGNSSGN